MITNPRFLTASYPISISGDNLSFNYNTTNLKITSTELNTIQDIATTSSPSFLALTINNGASQDYLFTNRSNSLAIQSQSTGTASGVEFYTKDGDGTDINANIFYGVGTPADVTNGEFGQIGWRTTDSAYIFRTGTNGTGTVQPLKLYTGANTSQLVLNIDGTTSFGAGVTATSFTIGANTLTTTEWANLDGLNQTLATTSSPSFVNLTINNGASQDYLFTNRGNLLSLQSQTSGQAFGLELFAKDGDGTDDVYFNIFGLGVPGDVVPFHALFTFWDKDTSQYFMQVLHSGDSYKPLILSADGTATQLKLNTDGKVFLRTVTDQSGWEIIASGDMYIGGALLATGHTTFEGVTSTGATGTGKLVYDTSPTFTGNPIFTGNPRINVAATSNGGFYWYNTALAVDKWWLAHNTSNDSIYFYHYTDAGVFDWSFQWMDSSGNMMVRNNLTIGVGAGGTDYTLTFNGETNDGVITYMEDEDRFDFDNDVKVTGRLTEAGTFADIHVHDASAGAQSIATGATYTKLTCWTDNGFSSNCTPDATNDKITITKAGLYRVACQLSFSSGTNNVEFKAAVFLNGTEQNQTHFERKIGTAGDVGSASFIGTIDVTTVPWDLDVRMAHDNAGAVNVTVEYGQLIVEYLGET